MKIKKIKNIGQAATELAVFGAIVIFIIGAIIRTAVTSSYSQNASLKAMRYAMLLSWQGSQAGTTARSTSTVLYIEDRLVPDFGKYGSLERNPFVMQGSGTFSNMLLYPLDWEDVINPKNWPTFDSYINGKHFVFITGKAKTIAIDPPLTEGGSMRFEDYYAQDDIPSEALINGRNGIYKGWNFKCVAKKPDPNKNQIDGYYGCPVFYTVVPNYSSSSTFCSQSPCPTDKENVLSIDQRFDLNRNDNYNDDNIYITGGYSSRQYLAWQWRAVNGIVANIDKKIDTKEGNYPSFDIDGDSQEETIYAVRSCENWQRTDKAACAEADDYKKKVIREMDVMDYQDGDIDMSQGVTVSNRGRIGLLPETAIYTRSKTGKDAKGTILRIKEGKLLDATVLNPEGKSFVRSRSFNDQVDLVERRVRLSADTGRVCSGEATPKADGTADPTAVICVGTPATNGDTGVDVNGTPTGRIGECFMPMTVDKTCFDRRSKVLYVRTGIDNRRGHLWVTEASGEFNPK